MAFAILLLCSASSGPLCWAFWETRGVNSWLNLKARVAEVSSQQHGRVAKVWVKGLLSEYSVCRAVCLQMSTF